MLYRFIALGHFALNIVYVGNLGWKDRYYVFIVVEFVAKRNRFNQLAGTF